MTLEEAIKTLKENYCAMCVYGSQDMDSCDIRSCDNKDAIKALEQGLYDFASWVAEEIFDDNWEYNKDAFAELACRKLAKLGIVKEDGDKWEFIEPQESEGEE